MLQYSGPVYQSRETDRRGDFILQGAQALGNGIAAGFDGVRQNLDKSSETRRERGFIEAQWEAIKPLVMKLPEGNSLLQKFETGGLNQQRGLLTGVQALIAEQRTAAAEQQKQQNWNAQFGLDVSREANRATEANRRLNQVDNPPLPKEANVGGTDMIWNGNNWMQKPDNTGAQFNVPKDSPAGVVTYNGRPMGAFPVPKAPEGYKVQYDKESGTYVATMDRKPVDTGNILTESDGGPDSPLFPQGMPPGQNSGPSAALLGAKPPPGGYAMPSYQMPPPLPEPAAGSGIALPTRAADTRAYRPAVPQIEAPAGSGTSRVPLRGAPSTRPAAQAPSGKKKLVPLTGTKAATDKAPRVIEVADPADPNVKRQMMWNENQTALIPVPVVKGKEEPGAASGKSPLESSLGKWLETLNIKQQ